jgi:hypothetical protein
MAGAMSSATSITGADGTPTDRRQAVTRRFFDVLGVTPIVGRTFQPSDERPLSDVVVIGEGCGEVTSEATRRQSDVLFASAGGCSRSSAWFRRPSSSISPDSRALA